MGFTCLSQGKHLHQWKLKKLTMQLYFFIFMFNYIQCKLDMVFWQPCLGLDQICICLCLASSGLLRLGSPRLGLVNSDSVLASPREKCLNHITGFTYVFVWFELSVNDDVVRQQGSNWQSTTIIEYWLKLIVLIVVKMETGLIAMVI